MTTLVIGVVLAVTLYQVQTADICAPEFDDALTCLKTRFEGTKKELNHTVLENIGDKIRKCFEVNNCTAPNFEQNVTDHIPEEYREAAQLFVETVQGFPDDFRRCVIKKSRHAMLSGVESCVQNVTESLSDFQFPELDLPEGPKTDEEKKEAHALFGAHINTIVSLQKCHAEKGNESAIQVDDCIKEATRDRQQHACRIKQSCRANLTDSDNRTCSSRLDQACIATIHCLQDKKAEVKSFFDHIVEGFKQAAVEGAKAAKSIVGPELQDIVIACEKETKYKVPKATVLKIFVKLPKRLPPQEVLDFLKLFADLQQEDQINPCESCEEILVPSGNATAVKVGNELENPANITLESTVSLNSTSEALNATVVDTTEATTKKHSKKKHD